MTVAFSTLSAAFSDLIWNLIRLAGFFMVVPIFGNQLIPARVRLLLTFSVALALTPILTGAPDITQWRADMILDILVQGLMGVGLGFAAIIFFHIFVIAGQFIGMQMGLGFAAMVDPGNGVQVTVWSQFFLMLVTLSFLALNGHLILVEILVEIFRNHPVGSEFETSNLFHYLSSLGGWMFMGGALIALPAVVALLIVNLAFGVMNRAAPQLNVFSLGFPFGLMFGLVIIWFLLSGWSAHFPNLMGEFIEVVQEPFLP